MAHIGGEGWIKLYRSTLTDPIWLKSSNEHKTIFTILLLLANHTENEWVWCGEKFRVERGQFITSINNIIEASGGTVTTQNVRSALKKFEKLKFLTYKATKTGTLITIANWDKYQHTDAKPNTDTNKEVTKSQQRGNKEVTTNKNDKNYKKEKEEKATDCFRFTVFE